MFLNLLTPDQQRAFIQGARLVAASDGVAEEEEALLEAIEAECGHQDSPDDATLPEALKAAEESLDSQTSRKTFLLELAGVAAIDGRAYPAELEIFGEFAERLHITKSDLQECLELATRARQLVLDSETFIATSAAAA